MPSQQPNLFNRRTVLKGAGATAAALGAIPLLRPVAGHAQETPRQGGTLRYGLNVEPVQMNQLSTNWMTDATQHLYDRLVTIDPEGAYVPHLATWEVSEDGLNWTFTLREGVTFHSGAPVTAEAVKWWFDQASDPESLYALRSFYDAVASTEVVDPLTVAVALSRPNPTLQFVLYTVYSGIMNPTTYEELGAEEFGLSGVDGTGPFTLREFIPGDRLVIDRNDAYAWAPAFVENQGPPHLDSIEYRYIPDASARSTAIEAGDLDLVVQPNPADVERLSQNPQLTVLTKPQAGLRLFAFNCARPPFDDKRVRQAMAHAVQRDPIVERVMFGLGIPAYSWVPPTFETMYEPETATFFPYDPAAGRELLAAAGLTDEDGDGFVEYDGEPWQPEIMVGSESELSQLAQVMQAQMSDIGINFQITQVDFQTGSDRVTNDDFDTDLTFYVWDGLDTTAADVSLSSNIESGTNWINFSDPGADAVIERMLAAPTLAERYAIFMELQQLLHGDLVPILPIYHPFDVYVMSNRVRGYQPNTYTLYPRMHDVWLAE